jgi:subtilase family serine protease
MTRLRLTAAASLCSTFALGAAVQAPLASAARAVVQAASPLTRESSPEAATPASAPVEFTVGLVPSNLAGAEAFAKAVSTPGGPSYRRFLTPSEWEKRFSPKSSAVSTVKSWLREQGIAVESVSPDRLSIEASADAATIERAFGTSLHQYQRHGRSVRLASAALSVPASVAGLISGISGVDQRLATPDHARPPARAPPRPRRATKKSRSPKASATPGRARVTTAKSSTPTIPPSANTPRRCRTRRAATRRRSCRARTHWPGRSPTGWTAAA